MKVASPDIPVRRQSPAIVGVTSRGVDVTTPVALGLIIAVLPRRTGRVGAAGGGEGVGAGFEVQRSRS